MLIQILGVIAVALVFEYINGFHDTANVIATSVSTKVLTPRQAVVLAAVCNLAGAMVGVSVAKTIGEGLAAVTGVGLAAHLVGQVATGRLFKGGPAPDEAAKPAEKKGGDAS